MSPRRFPVTAFLICTLAALSQSSRGEDAGVGEEWVTPDETTHFRYFRVGEVPDDVMRNVASSLNREGPRVLGSLGVDADAYGDDLMFRESTRVVIWQLQTEFSQSFGSGEVPGGAAQFAGGYVSVLPERREIRLFNRGPATATTAVHEFVHVASLAINPQIAHRPTWLWEGVAQYLADERPDTTALSCLTQSRAPTMEQIEEFPQSLVYNWVSYLMVQFVAARGGNDAIIDMIKTNADFEAVLKLTEKQFYQGWLAYVRERYPLSDDLESMTAQELGRQLPDYTFDSLETRLSAYLAPDGSMLIGRDGQVTMRARWSIDPAGHVIREAADLPTSRSTWFELGEDRYRMAPAKDCRYQNYVRRSGNPEGLK